MLGCPTGIMSAEAYVSRLSCLCSPPVFWSETNPFCMPMISATYLSSFASRSDSLEPFCPHLASLADSTECMLLTQDASWAQNGSKLSDLETKGGETHGRCYGETEWVDFTSWPCCRCRYSGNAKQKIVISQTEDCDQPSWLRPQSQGGETPETQRAGIMG